MSAIEELHDLCRDHGLLWHAHGVGEPRGEPYTVFVAVSRTRRKNDRTDVRTLAHARAGSLEEAASVVLSTLPA